MKKIAVMLIAILLIFITNKTIYCSELRDITQMLEVSASSTLSSSTYDFSPKNVLDGNPETAWQPSGDGVGEWIEFYPTREKSEGIGGFTITAINILNGYQFYDPKYGDLYKLNNRMAQVTISWQYSEDSSGREVFKLQDQKGWQAIPVNIPGGSRIRILVNSIYKGSKWDDLAVSDISITGRLEY